MSRRIELIDAEEYLAGRPEPAGTVPGALRRFSEGIEAVASEIADRHGLRPFVVLAPDAPDPGTVSYCFAFFGRRFGDGEAAAEELARSAFQVYGVRPRVLERRHGGVAYAFNTTTGDPLPPIQADGKEVA